MLGMKFCFLEAGVFGVFSLPAFAQEEEGAESGYQEEDAYSNADTDTYPGGGSETLGCECGAGRRERCGELAW